MAKLEANSWQEQFKRFCSYKANIIIEGNTRDIVANGCNGKYETVTDTIVALLKSLNYKVLKWDRVDGIDQSNEYFDYKPEHNEQGGQAYDIGGSLGDLRCSHKADYKEPEEFFQYLWNVVKNSKGKNAYVLDYSDQLFGNANALSEKERKYLTALGKAIAKSRSYDMFNPNLMTEGGSIVVIITHNKASIPPDLYLNNPLAASINVPLPGRSEREAFVDSNINFLKVAVDYRIPANKVAKDDFVDSLEGLTLCEIVQLMQLSNNTSEDCSPTRRLSGEKLINLFRYGEKVSPWEELSKEKLEEIRERLGQRVKGQNQAIDKVRDVVIRAYTGFSGLQHSAKQKKPKGSLFFVGPTGVGKTELAKALAEFVFGDENACIRFDMSEFNHEHSDQRLVGAPPGYVGYEAGGQLTNAVKAKPFCVLLFDEIEKAHGKILDKFLQILEDGRLTDGKGETVSFAETIIIFTSNIGASEVNPDFGQAQVRKDFLEAVRKHFVEELGRPELLNRIGDNIVAFNFISDPSVFNKIAEMKFKQIQSYVQEHYQAKLDFADKEAALSAIANNTNIADGGRGLGNLMETYIVNPLAEFVFENKDDLRMSKIVITQRRPESIVFGFELR